MHKPTAAQISALVVALLAVAAIVISIVGLNQPTTTPSSPAIAARPTLTLAQQTCPAGEAQMGCATVKPTLAPRAVKPGARPPGPIFPDVSEFQGHPDWAAARSSIVGFVAKAGEYRQDHDYSFNAGEARRLHITFGAYWFVRNYGCAVEAARIASVIRANPTPAFLVLDMEVPEAAGYASCLSRTVFAQLHLRVVIYTAPGTWPGGSMAGLQVWIASYGPSHPPVVFGNPVAFQYTDGVFGSPTRIPGVPLGDVSVNYRLFAPPAPPDPYALYPKTVRHFRGGVTASEHNTVATWDRAKCLNPVKRAVCRSSRSHLVLLRDRDVRLAHLPGHSFASDHLGARVHGLQARLHQTKR